MFQLVLNFRYARPDLHRFFKLGFLLSINLIDLGM